MKKKRFYNKAWKFIKKALKDRLCTIACTLFITLVVGFIVYIVFRYSQTAWYFFIAVLNEKPPIKNDQSLQLAIGLLTLLVTIIAISMGVITWWTRTDWNRFRKKQEPIIEELKKETDELDWINKIRKGVEKNPHLDADDADTKKAIPDIKKHYFERDQYNEAWKYFGVARWYEIEERYGKEEQCRYAIKYFKKADRVDLDDNHSESNKLRKHIRQSLGKNYFQHGLQLEEKGKKADTIKDYEAAIECYDWVIKYDPQFAMAHFNKASTLIQLGKIKGDKTEPYNDASYCYKEAIKCLREIEGNYEHFYEHFYDKARAHALLEQPDEAIESLRHSFRLAERDYLGDLFLYLARDSEDFKHVEGKEKFKALLKQY